MTPTVEVLRGQHRRQVAAELARLFLACGEPPIGQFALSVNRYPALVRRLLIEAGVCNEAACVGLGEDELEDRVRDRFGAGTTIAELAYATGIDRRRLSRILHAAGLLVTTPPAPIAPATAADCVAAYQAGASIREVCRRFGLPFSPVRSLLLAAGIRLRPRSGHRRRSSHDESRTARNRLPGTTSVTTSGAHP